MVNFLLGVLLGLEIVFPIVGFLSASCNGSMFLFIMANPILLILWVIMIFLTLAVVGRLLVNENLRQWGVKQK